MIELIKIKNKYFCHVSIMDKKALMFLDTGSSMSSIANKFCGDSTVVAHVKQAGQSGELGETLEVKRVNDIDIDGFKIKYHNFIVKDETIGDYLCDGIIGADLLFKENLILDFKNNTLSFSPIKINEGLEFSHQNNGILFNIKLNDIELRNMIFDTGASLFSIDKSLAKKYNLNKVKNEEDFKICDSNGIIIDHETYLVENIEIGNLSKDNLIAHGFCFEKINKLKKEPENGIIGQVVFDKQVFKFDFSTKKCIIC
ncbi:MAG: aspartyl protease family protein [Candidatus Delongbacteria bacterium]|nr:aspartyl protease family protein [Candidatus Delongbacteria bacterium]